MEERILSIIKAIRESFGGSVAIYTQGNCYHFYEILKSIFPEAEPYESGGHVLTKIDDNYYDIRGKLKANINLIPLEDYRIESLTKNKWTDERVQEYSNEWKEILKNRKSDLPEGEQYLKQDELGRVHIYGHKIKK